MLLRVAGLDRAHHADYPGLRHRAGQHAVEIPALLRGYVVRENVFQSPGRAGIGGGPPGEGDFREIPRHVHDGTGDDHVVAAVRVISNRGGGFRNVEHFLGIGDFQRARPAGFRLQPHERVVHRLAPGHVGDAAGQHDRDAGFRARSRLCVTASQCAQQHQRKHD